MEELEFPAYVLAAAAETSPGPAPWLARTTARDILTLSGPGQPTGVALFTDRDGAEQFRDENAAGFQVVEILAADELLAVLRAARPSAEVVAVDPWRLGKRSAVLYIDDLIRWNAPPPEPPAPPAGE